MLFLNNFLVVFVVQFPHAHDKSNVPNDVTKIKCFDERRAVL